MANSIIPTHDPQAATTDYFERDAPFWEDLYSREDVFAVIHRERAVRAAAEIERLPLVSGSRALEIGCGAGLLAVHLAKRGFAVDATDSTPAMVELTRQKAELAGVGSNLRTAIADVHALQYADASFDLVVAMGVLPWLHDPTEALREMARVLRSGGFLIANTDNRWRLTHVIDPLFNPWLQPVRRVLGRRHARTGPAATTVWRRRFERDLKTAGLRRVRGFTFGFGPFTIFGRPAVKEVTGVRLHTRLQRMADAGVPILRSSGSQYLVVARTQ